MGDEDSSLRTLEEATSARFAAAVLEAMSALADCHVPSAVIDAMLAQIERRFSASFVLFHEIEEDGSLRLCAARGAPAELAHELSTLSPAEGTLAACVLEGKKPRLVTAEQDAVKLADVQAIRARMDCAAILCAPMLAGKQRRGVLTCAPAAAGSDAASLIEVLAGMLACALERTRAHERLTRRVEALGRAQDVLRDAEQRWNRTFDDAPIGMALVAPDGLFMRVNRALCRITGYPRDELERLRFQDITHPEDLEVDLDHVERLVRGEIDRYQLGKRYLRKDGAIVDALLHTSLVRDLRGRPLHFISQIEDVTEKKRVEELLLRSERKYHAIFDTAREALVVTDGDMHVQEVNPAACELLRSTREMLLARPLPALLEDTSVGQFSTQWEALLSKGELSGELTLYLRDGRAIPVELGARAHFVPGAHLFTLRDVTRRKRAEEERERLHARIAAERRWLRSVVEHSPVGIVLVEGAYGEEVVVNRRAEEIFGKSPAATGDERWYYWTLERDAAGRPLPEYEHALIRALRGETTRGRELFVQKPGGELLPVLVSAGPIHDAQGRLLAAIATYEDISLLKNLERLREEWTSVVAHELRQPLTAITSHASLLASGAAPPQKGRAEHILRSALRMDRMVGDLLDASRIEACQLRLERQPTELSTLIRGAIERAAVENVKNAISLVQDGELPAVDIDAARIEQVLSNLLSNAAKYGAPDTGIRIVVERRGPEVFVAVHNRGPHIKAEELSRLFQRFQRLDGGRSRPGSGLGLYICRGIIEAHGGRIWAESEVDRTTFGFTLPVAAAH